MLGTYWSAGPEPGCVTKRLNTHRTCEKKKASKRGEDRLGANGELSENTTRTGAKKVIATKPNPIAKLNMNATKVLLVGVNSVYVNAGP